MSTDEIVALAGVAAGVLALLWVGILAVHTRPRAPRAGPATMELGDEPPAVVDLLTDDFEVTPESVPATVLDLAARRWLTIDEHGNDVVIRLRRSGEGTLRPFESQVLEHLRGLAVDGVVPAAAMTTGPRAASDAWWKRFRQSVVREAADRGLCRPRWGGVGVLLVWAGVVASLGCAWWAGEEADDHASFRLLDGLVGASFALGMGVGAIATLISGSDRQRETPEGLEAAARWLGVRRFLDSHGDFATKPAAAVAVWDRYLAHAAALDLAPLAVAQLPLGAEDDRHAWSRATGRWRQVTVRYPRLRPGHGQHPLVAGAVGAFVVWVGLPVFRWAWSAAAETSWGGLSPAVAVWVQRAAGVVTVLVGLALAWSAAKVAFAAVDLVGSRTVEGIALRCRRRGGGSLSTNPLAALGSSQDTWRSSYHVAVDDGTTDRIDAWRVSPVLYRRVRQGTPVRLKVTPLLRHVRSVEPAREPATAPVPPPADDADLVAAARRLAESHGPDRAG